MAFIREFGKSPGPLPSPSHHHPDLVETGALCRPAPPGRCPTVPLRNGRLEFHAPGSLGDASPWHLPPYMSGTRGPGIEVAAPRRRGVADFLETSCRCDAVVLIGCTIYSGDALALPNISKWLWICASSSLGECVQTFWDLVPIICDMNTGYFLCS